ncbi:MAG: sigma-70 family RNA polymerase sigma factor, partial [Planctomycetota bacterium]|nr:sigma-70 family RNA polymerase sigma factor [Planctomycetota bacterium]
MPPQDPISNQIIRPSQAKSHSEWLTLAYKSVAPDLLKLALHATRCPEEAEDTVQEVFLYALQNERTRPAGISMDEWLLQRLADRLAKRNLQKEPASYGAEYAETIPTRRWEPVTQMQEAELNEQLRSAIEILPQSYREVVLLGVQGGRNSLEIGAILGRPATTVRSQLARGLDRLRRALPPTLGFFALFGTEGSANADPLGTSLALSKMRDRCIERSTQWAPTTAAPWGISPSLTWKCAAILMASVASMMLWSSMASEPKAHARDVAALSPEVRGQAALEEPSLAPIALDSLRETQAAIPTSHGSMELAQVAGQVVGPDGSALPGVEVQLFTWSEWDTTGQVPELMGEARFGWTTRTDESGRFEFEAPLPHKGNPVVSVQAGMGFTQQNVYFNSTHSNRPPLRTGPNELGVIRLEHAGRVAGVLLDEYGAPAFPAEVILSPGT